MQRSEDRILTTHVGSLPRDPRLTDLLIEQEQGRTIDTAELAREAESAVRHVVRAQLEAGVDVGNDGEQPRVGFQTYVPQRMRGFGGESARPTPQDMAEFPDFLAMMQRRNMMRAKVFNAPQAVADVVYDDLSAQIHMKKCRLCNATKTHPTFIPTVKPFTCKGPYKL